ncbi:MAG: hypothetical protein ACRENP_02365 [Longimicrobiales bacterium]
MLTCATVLFSGCLDFIEPDLPEAGAPAVLQMNLNLDETGQLHTNAILVPSLTVDGLNRNVPDDTLRVSGLEFVPSNVRRNGTRLYSVNTRVNDPVAFVRPLRIQPPQVTGVSAPPPVVAWFALERADPDTVVARVGEELMLHLVVEPGGAQPEPDQRLWILELVRDSASFRISAAGAPPTTLRIPAHWVPAGRSERMSAYLTYYLTGTYRPAPGDYLHSLAVNLRIRWHIRLQPTSLP